MIVFVIHQELIVAKGSPVRVDQKQLSSRVAVFMKTPQSEKVWAELETPAWAGLILSGLTFLSGFLMLFTIRWSLDGIKRIYSALMLEAVRDCKSPARKNLSLLSPLICHGVITNPQTNLGAVLGAFDEAIDHNRLASIALQMGENYSEGSYRQTPPEISAILQDDKYEPYRRRLIPESYCGILNLYLFDVTLNPMDGERSDRGSVMYAFVATNDKSQLIEQIPWSIAAPCVSKDGSGSASLSARHLL